MNSDASLQVTVELVELTDPIHGTVTDETGTPRPFDGWTGLLTALDAVIDQSKHHTRPAERGK